MTNKTDASPGKPWENCKEHGRAESNVWACPKCLIELREERDALRAEVASLRAELAAQQAAVGWRPIETAPAEGQFLVYMPTDKRQPIQVAKWHPKLKVIGNVFAFDAQPPTHWMPMPTPPDEPAKVAHGEQ